MITVTQKQAAQAIINIFETDAVLGDYGDVTVISGDTGHLTFGRSQTTLGSGNLALLIQRYCDNVGARFATKLRSFLPRFVARDSALDDEKYLQNILRASSDDLVMRDTQDVFFDDAYWTPAKRAGDQMGISTPLGLTVVYDGHVHGSWEAMRDRTTGRFGALTTIGEKAWITGLRPVRWTPP